jgi:hypothetical protein
VVVAISRGGPVGRGPSVTAGRNTAPLGNRSVSASPRAERFKFGEGGFPTSWLTTTTGTSASDDPPSTTTDSEEDIDRATTCDDEGSCLSDTLHEALNPF